MAWVHDTVAAFGQSLGIEGLTLSEHGLAQLHLASGGLVAVEPVRRLQHDEVLVYLGRPVGHDGGRAIRKAMALSHFGGNEPLPVRVGLRGQGADTLLLALVRLPERGFTPQALAHAVDHLGRWLDDAGIPQPR